MMPGAVGDLAIARRHARKRSYGSHSGRMVRRDSALLDPRHILAAADADGAAFDPDGARVDLEEMSRVAIAVVDVVEPSRPVAGPSGTRL
jgi:hypothetical protein